jgi:hypothetical protein
MKKIISFVFIIVLIVGLVVFGVWFLKQKKSLNENPSQNTPTKTLPVVTNNPSQGTPPEQPSNPVIQNNKDPNNGIVVSNFLHQIKNSTAIKLYGTVIDSNYALQEWGDNNKGGQALLQYTDAGGWTLISMGGGVWDVNGLISFGVPVSIAKNLVNRLKN